MTSVQRTDRLAEPAGGTVVTRAPGPAELRPRAHARRQRVIKLSLSIGVPVGLLLLWQVASDSTWIDPRLYPSPTTIAEAAWDMAVSGVLWHDLWISCQRVLLGFLLGAVVGLALGVLTGLSKYVRAALEPMLNGLYTVPKLALLPIFLTIFGLGEGPKIVLIAVTVFFYVWISTMSAILVVPKGYREAAVSFGAGNWQMFTKVVLPAALPQTFVGLRISMATAVLVLVGAEFIVGNDGLGYVIFNSRSLLQNERMYVGIVCAALLGVVASAIVRWLGRRLSPWSPEDNAISPQ